MYCSPTQKYVEHDLAMNHRILSLSFLLTEVFILLGLIATMNHLDNSFAEDLDAASSPDKDNQWATTTSLCDCAIPLLLPLGHLCQVSSREILLVSESHDSKSFLVVCTSGNFDFGDVQTVEEVNEQMKIHRLSHVFGRLLSSAEENVCHNET